MAIFFFFVVFSFVIFWKSARSRGRGRSRRGSCVCLRLGSFVLLPVAQLGARFHGMEEVVVRTHQVHQNFSNTYRPSPARTSSPESNWSPKWTPTRWSSITFHLTDSFLGASLSLYKPTFPTFKSLSRFLSMAWSVSGSHKIETGKPTCDRQRFV